MRRVGRPRSTNRLNAAARCSDSAKSSCASNCLTRVASAVDRGTAWAVIGASRSLVVVIAVPFPLELEGKLGSTAGRDAAFGHHVHHIGFDVVQKPWIVGNDEKASARIA